MNVFSDNFSFVLIGIEMICAAVQGMQLVRLWYLVIGQDLILSKDRRLIIHMLPEASFTPLGYPF